ncbi:MAG: hypothetical protein K0R82_240 [Flavipsychrobacter sp.]|jgi:hypothetical protein|nr:hypothetical protein [Flavipsychrobacter sp.]
MTIKQVTYITVPKCLDRMQVIPFYLDDVKTWPSGRNPKPSNLLTIKTPFIFLYQRSFYNFHPTTINT